ncbi:hypothetical protein [Haloferax sp. Q22]|uniref:hypothetical protein n=1 Tax=Haloferax sp. (strain Q22) TaxID=1526048 RepID=UPI000AC43F05|nr:hypothetical protein [Haloferax sp. Q22]
MVPNLQPGLNRILTKGLTPVVGLILLSSPVAAQTGTEDCSIPSSLQPLFDLLNTVEVLAFSGGVALGVIGMSVAGLMIAGPFGEDWVRRGKQLAKNTILGVVILASANMVVAFLIGQLSPSFCT